MRAEKAFAGLAELDVRAGEIAFVFSEPSAMAVRTSRHTFLFDPANFFSLEEVAALGKVDAILITHEHFDHFDASRAIELQRATGAALLCNPGAQASLSGKVREKKLKVMEANETAEVNGAKVIAMESVHPGKKPLMFLVEADGSRFFHGSDSGYTPAIEKYKGKARVAFVPVGAPSPTASVDDAVRMVKALGCEKAVPIHGSGDEASEFEEKMGAEMPKVQVVIPEQLKVYKI